MKSPGRRTIRVSSVQQFVQVVCRLRDEWIVGGNFFDPWFRGQAKAKWPLSPSIFRYDLLTEEDELRGEFQRRGPQYMVEVPPGDFWGWYFLMQHYGAPTRLLDWTDSALVALFFALNSDRPVVDNAEDSAVWMLDPWWLNKSVLKNESILLPDFDAAAPYLYPPYDHLDEKGNTHIKPQFPVAIDPPFIARRVAVQRSHFTIFGHDRSGLTKLAADDKGHLVKIIVEKEQADRMRADLLTLGFSDTSLYPDLRGLSSELIRYSTRGWPPD
jgi:hypothetical protein